MLAQSKDGGLGVLPNHLASSNASVSRFAAPQVNLRKDFGLNIRLLMSSSTAPSFGNEVYLSQRAFHGPQQKGSPISIGLPENYLTRRSRLEAEPQRELSKPPLVVVAAGGQSIQSALQPHDLQWRCRWTGLQ
jgi:hypothetical protein